MGLHQSVELHKPGTQMLKIKHNLWQGIFYSTATFHGDHPTHRIAPECAIHFSGAQDAQNEPHWHIIRKCSN